MPKPVSEGAVLAARLAQPVAEVIDPISQRAMIIMGRHNPNIITEYTIEPIAAAKTPQERDDSVSLSEERQQTLLERIDTSRGDSKRFVWDRVLPLLIGFELAQAEVKNEVHQLFGNEIPVNLAAMKRLLNDAAYATAVTFVAEQFGLTAYQARALLRSKLDEQANRQRTNAGPVPHQPAERSG